MSKSTISSAIATVAAANTSAASLVVSKLLGKAAINAIFENPTVKEGLLLTGAMLGVASTADEKRAHGKVLNELAFGMAVHTADEVLRACEEAEVFTNKDVKYAAADSDVVFTSPQLLNLINTAKSESKEGERLFCLAAPAVIPATPAEAPNAVKKSETKATPDKAKVISPEEVSVKLDLSKVVVSVPKADEKIELVCAICGQKLTKQKEMKPFVAPNDGLDSEDEIKYNGSYLCAKHHSRLNSDHAQRKAAVAKDAAREKKMNGLITELEELKGKVASETTELAEAEAAVSLIDNAIVKEGAEKQLEERRLCLAKTSRLLTQKEAQYLQLQNSAIKAAKYSSSK